MTHTAVYIKGAGDSFRFLGNNIKYLTWSAHVSALVKKVQLYFLKKLKKVKFPCKVLVNFSRGAIECILIGNITSWHGMCTAQDRRVNQNCSDHW